MLSSAEKAKSFALETENLRLAGVISACCVHEYRGAQKDNISLTDKISGHDFSLLH